MSQNSVKNSFRANLFQMTWPQSACNMIAVFCMVKMHLDTLYILTYLFSKPSGEAR